MKGLSLALTRSKKGIDKIGIDSDTIPRLTENIMLIVRERQNAEKAASDMVNLRLTARIESTENKYTTNQLKMKQKIDWRKHQLGELQEETDTLEERKMNLKSLSL